jgi:hypothetical protein
MVLAGVNGASFPICILSARHHMHTLPSHQIARDTPSHAMESRSILGPSHQRSVNSLLHQLLHLVLLATRLASHVDKL